MDKKKADKDSRPEVTLYDPSKEAPFTRSERVEKRMTSAAKRTSDDVVDEKRNAAQRVIDKLMPRQKKR